MTNKEVGLLVFFMFMVVVLVFGVGYIEDKKDLENKELYITCIDQIQNKEMCASLLK
jgi:hypothetical protein